jgi:cyclophilin family peptidyl-prolyl cis-trans isomerase/HEAT repeat protein
MLKQYFHILIIAIFITSCVPAFERNNDMVEVSLEDNEVRELFRLQDEQKIDSLYTFFNDRRATSAYLSTMAFASILAEESIDSLISQLDNPNLDVRAAAAFSLGQLKNAKAEGPLIEAFKNKDTLDINNNSNANILEAIGKCGGEGMLNAMSTVSTYVKSDTMLLLGQARGIYRYALRGITVPAGTERMITMVLDETYPSEARLIAAHYLARAKEIDIEKHKFQLVKFLTSDPDPNIRMAIARAMGKTTDLEIHSYLLNHLSLEEDYRVKVNIIRALETFPQEKSIEAILALLNDKNPHVADAAGNFLINNGSPAEANYYKTLISDSLSYAVNGKLYEAVLKNLPHYFVNTRKKLESDILEKVKDGESDQEKIAYIRALAHNPRSYTALDKLIKETKSEPVATASVESIYGLLKSEHFIKTFKTAHVRRRKEVGDIIIKLLDNGDSGVSAVIADMIIDPETSLSGIISEIQYLQKAKDALTLPREIETYNKLQEAISILLQEEFTPKKVEYNNPIDWAVIEGVTDSSMWTIKTSKGDISFNPYPGSAPGSVANFKKLADSNFYDKKIFHRVVPNFVVQAGCPRGDGYGSLDYSIRSEFANEYYNDEGYIGMASAGPHTEGTQFFITHSPTPHLDGRYTIFGKVDDGMDVVHTILPGDQILDVITN